LGITPGCVLVLTDQEWAFYQKSDPLAAFYQQVMRLDIHAEPLVEHPKTILELPLTWFRAEIADSLVQATSVLARNQTNYFLDLWCGQIRVYRKAVQEGVWDLTPPWMEKNLFVPSETLTTYRYGSERDVDRLPFWKLWPSV